ncbi:MULTISPECIES: MFS transporter [Cyanophyceae]|uniref:MFS transporter n=1 Tax=Leptolyngbya subtilissima DQ-A4 TaxID=2933933 RepID=A0ABV0JZB6_9CYAN|nr:MFS transporter [Nodosilinea sp. FACHB-141]MBD2112461.1 MFS transporter [Nodosilinea sp. FACHB-141]
MAKLPPLPISVKVFYGVGELAASVPASLSAFFVLYFFTTVAGLSPALAGSVLLFGRTWDAIDDPLIGWLSDRTVSPAGRRYPWMLGGVIPMAICSVLLWMVPPFASQWGVFAYYIVLSLFAFAAFTAVQLPYTALAAELSDDYDERTDLIGMKSAFSIGASILALVMAQVVFARVADPARQFFILGLLSASLAVVIIGLCVAGTYRRYWQVQQSRPPLTGGHHSPALLPQLRSVFSNAAFREVLGLYLCGWMSVQVTAAMLPYFVGAWMGLPATHFAQMALAVQGTAIAMLWVWDWVAKRTGKRTVFLTGAPLAAIALAGLATVQPGQVVWMYTLGVIAGMGVATLYMVPFAMLPDVIDLDELNTGLRREGLYFSALVFLQKLGLAMALFISGQLLSLTGYVANTDTQPVAALNAIRLLIGPLPALLLIVGLWFCYRYPINRDRHQQILLALQQQRQQRFDNEANPSSDPSAPGA